MMEETHRHSAASVDLCLAHGCLVVCCKNCFTLLQTVSVARQVAAILDWATQVITSTFDMKESIIGWLARWMDSMLV